MMNRPSRDQSVGIERLESATVARGGVDRLTVYLSEERTAAGSLRDEQRPRSRRRRKQEEDEPEENPAPAAHALAV